MRLQRHELSEACLVEQAILAADGLRRRMLVPLARAAPRLVVSRDTRVAVGGVLLVSTALLTTMLAPAWVLALGPLVWGVPHVLADVRYLVVRPGLHRQKLVCAALVAGIALSFVVGLRGALLGAGGAVIASNARVPRKLLVLVLLGVTWLLVAAGASMANVAFAHLHNLVALAFFCVWRRRSSPLYLLPLTAFFAGATFLALGGAEGWPLVKTLGSFELQLAREALAPTASPVTADRLVLLFAFAQSVHYVVWLVLVPAEARSRPTPPSVRQAVRAVVTDLGPLVLVVAGVAALFFAGWALFDVARARDLYLSAASFHGWLEVGAAAVLISEARRP